ncbi:class I SAM-dependent methyltransferase [Leptolyngbyaceae cyanobacterium UHCC 1019]
MPQINRGVRSLLSSPFIYDLFTKLIGETSYRRTLVEQYICPQENDRILDIGCGTGKIVQYLPNVNYLGFDASQKYIKAAQAEFYKETKDSISTKQVKFVCQEVNANNIKENACFDIVLALGILHHLSDLASLELFNTAIRNLKPGGKLITFDGVFTVNQSPLARWIISKDRGQNVRTEEAYLALASQVFSKITTSIRHDLIRIPYTHIILTCTK